MRELLLAGWVEALIWLLIAGMFLGLETFCPTLFLIWFSGGALGALIVALLGFNEIIQIIVFSVFSVLMLIFARPFVKHYIEKNKPAEPCNAYSIIGSKAIVLKPVNQANGTVKIMNTGETWSAYTEEQFDPIEINTQVIIKQVDGAKLVVVPKNNN